MATVGAPGRIAQRESARFTRGRSLVQSQLRPLAECRMTTAIRSHCGISRRLRAYGTQSADAARPPVERQVQSREPRAHARYAAEGCQLIASDRPGPCSRVGVTGERRGRRHVEPPPFPLEHGDCDPTMRRRTYARSLRPAPARRSCSEPRSEGRCRRPGRRSARRRPGRERCFRRSESRAHAMNQLRSR